MPVPDDLFLVGLIARIAVLGWRAAYLGRRLRLVQRERDAAQGWIRAAGEVGDRYETLAAVERTRADVVLLDVNLPGMNGPQRVNELRKRKFKGHILRGGRLRINPGEQG